jgi:glycosyltransferase involved in cell wall biosynthesis
MIPDNPAVSVIVPAYRVTPYIGETLNSLRGQSFRSFETIVVNDACPDSANLERVLEPYGDEIVYLRHQENAGLAIARNTGIRAARAPLIALLDSDDLWEPDYLSVQAALHQAHPEVDVIYPNAVIFGDSPAAGSTVMDHFPSHGEVTFESLVRRQCYVFGGATIRREALFRVGLFDADLRSAEDFDLWLRLARGGAKFFYHKRPLVRYRRRADSLSSAPLWMIDSVLRVYKKLLTEPDLTTGDRKALESGIELEEAQRELYLAKRAVYGENRSEALNRLRQANRVLRRGKINLAILALRVTPKMLFRFIHRRYPTEDSYLG